MLFRPNESIWLLKLLWYVKDSSEPVPGTSSGSSDQSVPGTSSGQAIPGTSRDRNASGASKDNSEEPKLQV